MPDNNTVRLRAMDDWSWIELDDANRFEICFELKESIFLSQTVLTQQLFPLRFLNGQIITMKFSCSSSYSDDSFYSDQSTILLETEQDLSLSSFDMLPSNEYDQFLKLWIKTTSQASLRSSILQQNDSNHGTTLAGKTKNNLFSSVFNPLFFIMAFLQLIRSKIPRLWSEWIWVMKIVRMERRTSQQISQPQCSAIWIWEPQPQSRSNFQGPNQTKMHDTFLYFDGFMEPVPRKMTLGSMIFNFAFICSSNSIF